MDSSFIPIIWGCCRARFSAQIYIFLPSRLHAHRPLYLFSANRLSYSTLVSSVSLPDFASRCPHFRHLGPVTIVYFAQAASFPNPRFCESVLGSALGPSVFLCPSIPSHEWPVQNRVVLSRTDKSVRFCVYDLPEHEHTVCLVRQVSRPQSEWAEPAQPPSKLNRPLRSHNHRLSQPTKLARTRLPSVTVHPDGHMTPTDWDGQIGDLAQRRLSNKPLLISSQMVKSEHIPSSGDKFSQILSITLLRWV
ncbi:unnamed protein product [Protopolystoma xenopodis]|uniref:Uncharacterized protein n=1 Tax=Protopolystoma xenopodis TaxID=117903 RepID=A0A448WDN0_9PLAT|nr:unnamed protein product [Protopolystoma xenopodis]